MCSVSEARPHVAGGPDPRMVRWDQRQIARDLFQVDGLGAVAPARDHHPTDPVGDEVGGGGTPCAEDRLLGSRIGTAALHGVRYVVADGEVTRDG